MLTSILVGWQDGSQLTVSLGNDRSGTGWPVVIPFGGVCREGSADRCGSSAGDNGMREEDFLKRCES